MSVGTPDAEVSVDESLIRELLLAFGYERKLK